MLLDEALSELSNSGVLPANVGLDVDVVDLYEWEDAPTEAFPTDSQNGANVVLVLACYGMGEPTDSARSFYDWVMSGAEGSPLDAVRFAVFGLGSSKTHGQYYNVIGRQVDKQLARLGAVRMHPRGEGDDSKMYAIDSEQPMLGRIEADYETWQSGFVAHIQDMVQLTAQQVTMSTAATEGGTRDSRPVQSSGPGGDTQAASTRGALLPLIRHSAATAEPLTVSQPRIVPGAVTMRVGKQTGLVNLSPAMEQSCWQLSLLPASATDRDALTYTTGDHVSVYPSNSPERVQELCQLAGWDTQAVISHTPKHSYAGKLAFPVDTPITVEALLTHYMDVVGPVPLAMLRALAAASSDDAHATQLTALSDADTYVTVVKHNHLILADLLREFPTAAAGLTLEQFVKAMPALKPRYYSISSAWETDGSGSGEVDITFRHVKTTTPLLLSRSGVCSTWMTKLQPDDIVPVTVRPSTFHLPSPGTPIMLISGGIGIAPFRAFLHARQHEYEADGAVGDALMFHGCRSPDDLIYKDLLDSAVRTKCHIAYSDGAHGHKMISDAVVDEGKDVWNALEAGAVVYVCGGATGFGRAVARAFRTVAARHGGLSPMSADAYFGTLLTSGRYLEDLSD